MEVALNNVEQSQNSCVIISLGQKRYIEKPIIKISLQCLFLTDEV